MTNKEQLIEQHIRQYQSRLKHIDELYERAHKVAENLNKTQADKASTHHDELKIYAEQRALLEQEVQKKTDEIKTMDVDHWREETIQSSGPMAIWDILAQKLEDFIERHE